ncbi:S-adenosyl-L-methionine-dependent methyltransferase [Naviculisporaceae sp. PSN 640]
MAEETTPSSPPAVESPAPAPAATSTPSSPAGATATETTILPAQHWVDNARAAGEDNTDADSFLTSDAQSSTASISSSVLEYREIYGRRYHSDRGDTQYWGANDEQQSEALDILHHTLMMCLDGKIYLAPIKPDIQKALDLGTGTGIWAIDFADEFPSCEVIGTDLSPIQPSWVPPNLKFEIDDFTKEWTFTPSSFDYIHGRWLTGSVPDWTEFFKQAYTALKPGGYLEIFEPSPLMETDDGTVAETNAMGQWGALFIAGGDKLGRSFRVAFDGTLKKALEEAGFKNIEEKDIKTPIGTWPKDKTQKVIGEYARAVVTADIEGHILFMATTLGWSREHILVYMATLRRELSDPTKHGYYRQKILWGMKPE